VSTISQDPKDTTGASTTPKEPAGVLTISQDPEETAGASTTPKEPAGVSTISQDPKETAGASTTPDLVDNDDDWVKSLGPVVKISLDPQSGPTTPEELAGKIVNLTILKQL
jgi:hypothetical protein